MRFSGITLSSANNRSQTVHTVWQVTDVVDQKQQGAQDAALWYTRDDWSPQT